MRICGKCGADNGDLPYNVTTSCYMCGNLCIVRPEQSDGPTSFGARLGGCLPDKGAEAAKASGLRSIDALPRKVDLRENLGAVEQHAGLNSCAASAVVSAFEHHRRKSGAPQKELSRLFVYFNARRARGDERKDTGASVEECLAALIAHGAPEETLWPYDLNRWSEEPPRQAYEAAAAADALDYARVAGREGVLNALALGYPVCFGCSLPDGAYQSGHETGVMTPPTEQEWRSEGTGGQAMLLVGYDLDQNLYVARNCWGAGHGDAGHLHIPFEIMDRGANPDSFWILGQLEAEPGLTLERARPAPGRMEAAGEAPAPTLAPAPAPAPGAEALRARISGELNSQISDLRQGLRDRLTSKKER